MKIIIIIETQEISCYNIWDDVLFGPEHNDNSIMMTLSTYFNKSPVALYCWVPQSADHLFEISKAIHHDSHLSSPITEI